MESSALIIVDVQNDFLEGGVLGAPSSRLIIPIINQYIRVFEEKNIPIYATRDWHPPDHISFIMRGGRWPPHCVKGTPGAEFPKELRLPKSTHIVSKATEPDLEAYSGFQGTDLEQTLKLSGTTELYVCGIATEYCVRSTVLDAIKKGFSTTLLLDAIAPIERSDSESAIKEMRQGGCKVARLDDILNII